MLRDVVFNHPVCCAFALVVVAYSVGGVAIWWPR